MSDHERIRTQYRRFAENKCKGYSDHYFGLAHAVADDDDLVEFVVYLRNDAELLNRLDHKDGWLKQIAAGGDSWLKENRHDVIRQAYIRTFCRPPTDSELTTAGEYLHIAPDPASGLRDLLWALLNSKEFILNH